MGRIARVCSIVILAFTAAQTAEVSVRRYYNELRAVNGFNPFMTTVCFIDHKEDGGGHPDNTGMDDTFFTLGFTKDFLATAKAKSIPLTEKTRKTFEGTDMLMSVSYVRGVKTQEDLFDHDHEDSNSWYTSYDLHDGPRVRVTFSISPSGRFTRAVYVNQQPLAAFKMYGKCESME